MSDTRITTAGLDDPHTEAFCATFHYDPDKPHTCHWQCNICGGALDDGGGCPHGHSPWDVPGLQRAECVAEPRHPYTWFLADDSGYPAPCMYCVHAALRDRHDPCRHSHHRPWRRWKATHRVLRWTRTLGITNGSVTIHSARCHGCIDRIYWRGKRAHILGISRETWRCWRNRHRRGVDIGLFGSCGKCVPWTCCGSVEWEHRPGCAEAAA